MQHNKAHAPSCLRLSVGEERLLTAGDGQRYATASTPNNREQV
jgi:hypothetical protein